MAMENYSLSDIASATRGSDEGFGGNMGFFWIFALLLLAGGGFGGFGNNNKTSDFSAFATASSQNEILLGQKFDALGQKINAIGDGICSSTYALNNAINGVGSQVSECCCNTQRGIDSVNYNGALNTASINATTTAQTQKILDALAENKIETLQSQINALQLQNAVAGVVRYPNASTYYAGNNPFCSGACSGF